MYYNTRHLLCAVRAFVFHCSLFGVGGAEIVFSGKCLRAFLTKSKYILENKITEQTDFNIYNIDIYLKEPIFSWKLFCVLQKYRWKKNLIPLEHPNSSSLEDQGIKQIFEAHVIQVCYITNKLLSLPILQICPKQVVKVNRTQVQL